MTKAISGRCLCGAVSYVATADPLVMLNCHCRDCQRASGSAYVPVVVVPIASFEVKGELRFHESVGDGGNTVQRGFCPLCGSPVANTLSRVPNIIGLMAGSLDDPSLHKPTMEIYTASAQAWDVMAADTQKCSGPPS